MAPALLGVAPGNPLAVGLSAQLYGPAFMAVSALLAVWSYRVFPTYPTTGFSAPVFFLGLGAVLAPAVTGVVVDRYGTGTAFPGAAAVAALTLAAKSYSEDDFGRRRAL